MTGPLPGSAAPLVLMAEHNAWANARLFASCRTVAEERLAERGDGYESAIGILRHLVQVEHAFFELAHGRPASRITTRTLAELSEGCAALDADYVAYARSLDPTGAAERRFVVPWFGFEVTLAEGILQPLTHSHKHRSDVSMLLPRLGGGGIQMDLQYLDELRGEGAGG